jgi:hypothetical protein
MYGFGLPTLAENTFSIILFKPPTLSEVATVGA